jgi:hypothetical protein
MYDLEEWLLAKMDQAFDQAASSHPQRSVYGPTAARLRTKSEAPVRLRQQMELTSGGRREVHLSIDRLAGRIKPDMGLPVASG